MTRLETCIEALKSYDSDEDKIFIYRSDAIAIVERIFGAEPSKEEILSPVIAAKGRQYETRNCKQ